MDPGELEPARAFVRRHHVHYDVRDELVVDGEERRKTGYRVRLWGVVPGKSLLPADAAESPFAQELVALAEQVVPQERGDTTIHIQPPAPALYDSRVVEGADEIGLDIRLAHGTFGDAPSGAAEDHCLRSIQQTPELLGAPQRD